MGVRKWNRLTAAERTRSKLTAADLGGCDLTGINLSGVTADRASFAAANLTDARLSGLPSSQASFDKTSFAGADLTRAKLTGGSFVGADFTRARLTGADLSGGCFRRASFAGADLTGATLAGVSLLGADLTGAVLADTRISGGWFDKHTRWPAGFVPPGDMTWHGAGADPRLAGKGKKAVAADVNGLMTRLHALIDPGRMKRTLDMLTSGKNQLFAEIEPTMVRGVVRSQREADLVYSCVLTDDGTYACCTPDLEPCMGLRGEPCKHILVLLIGLARAGELDPTTADRWATAGAARNHRWNKTTRNHVSDTLLKYKGVQAGEVDWRPTETIPEDYYAM
ncbi:pentapeptide repeat-containing protein [bacterium]|nr:pentapeptide repeat-containing protein [bacterium]